MKKKQAGTPAGKKIILFVSTMGPNAKSRSYLCPDGQTVDGVQTNEAPVKYLLRKYNQEITGILCIVSEAAGKPVKEQTYSSLQHFEHEVERFCAENGLNYPGSEKIDFPQDSGESAEATIAREVSRKLKPGEEIILETTGGFRNSIMLLLLLSRMLSYTGHPTACAVYSFFDQTNKGNDQVFDVSDLAGMFDLIGGMQELSSFGNVRTLRKYYEARPHDIKIDTLLKAVKTLLDTITLCRTRQLDAAMKRFNSAMEAAETCGDPLLPQLLPAFRRKYGNKMTLPGLIRWCVESDMIQQALTIYKENIPKYLLDRGDVLEVKAHAPKQDYQSQEEADFRDFAENVFYKSALQGYHEESVFSGYRIPNGTNVKALSRVVLDYNYILMLRNMTNHASDKVGERKENRARQLNKYSDRYKLPDETTAEDVKQAILQGLENMKPERMKQTCVSFSGKKKRLCGRSSERGK